MVARRNSKLREIRRVSHAVAQQNVRFFVAPRFVFSSRIPRNFVAASARLGANQYIVFRGVFGRKSRDKIVHVRENEEKKTRYICTISIIVSKEPGQ